MDTGILLTPLAVMAALGLTVAAFGWGRTGSGPRVSSRTVLVGALVLVLVMVVAGRLGAGPSSLVGRDTLARVLGLAMLMGAGVLTFLAARVRRGAELSVSAAPQSLDDAARAVRATGKPVQGIFRGRIACDEAVTSPSGVVCAFYEAELRAPADGRRKGPLLSTERGFGTTLWLKGERAMAAVSFSPAQLTAPEELRRCTMLGRVSAGLQAALADGAEPHAMEVTAFERIGRLGDSCLVVGELRAGPVPGSWEIRGAGRGPAPVVVGHNAAVLGRGALGRAATYFSAAVVLCASAAWVLARHGA